MERSTKRYIFLFCWWLGLVVIWDALFFTGHGQPIGIIGLDRWFIFAIFDPLLLVQSIFLWLVLKKYFPGDYNWRWVITMPLFAFLGYWIPIFLLAYLIGPG